MAKDWRLNAREKEKYELAERFGLTEELRRKGWAGISAKDSGRIGGSMRRNKNKPAE